MDFRFSNLAFNGGNDISSYILNTQHNQLLVNTDWIYNFIFAYTIEALPYQLYDTNILGHRFSKSPSNPPLLYTIYVKDSDQHIWEASFLRECEFLSLFQLGGTSHYIEDSIHLYQDLPLQERTKLEKHMLTSISLTTDTRCYEPITLRNQQSSIGSKNAVVNFTLYANQQINEMNQKTEYIDYPELYLRINESSSEELISDSAIIPKTIKFGQGNAPSLYTYFKNPIHQVLYDSLVNQFYSYFSKKNLNTLIFSKSSETIKELPVCFELVDKKAFKPTFTQ